MKRLFTMGDVAERWQALTGSPAPEVKQRIRFLREAGALPTARTRATDGNISRFIVGILVPTTHEAAPAATVRLLEQPGQMQEGDGEAVLLFGSNSLGEVLTTLIFRIRRHGPWRVGEVAMSDHAAFVTATRSDYAQLAARSQPIRYEFSASREPLSLGGVRPVRTTRAVDGIVLHRMAMLAAEFPSDLPPNVRRSLNPDEANA